MRRKRLILGAGLVITFVGVLIAVLFALVKREPSFYVQASMAPAEQRERLSKEALSKISEIESAFINYDGVEVSFTAEQLNAFFQQDFEYFGGDDNLPAGFHAPRVKIDDGRMKIGVRYGSGTFSTILSIELKVWLIGGETNLVAVEIIGLQAGSMPLSTSTLLDYISEAARNWKADLTWYRKDGHPVAVLRFQAENSRPTYQIDQLSLEQGALNIRLRSTDILPAAAKPEAKGP